ncbi:MAG: hypothetical protein AAB922_04755 [Patescibacteria group bacterium]
MDLNLFCDESREKLAKPFNYDKYTYATNGKILVRVKKDPQYNDNVGVDVLRLPFDHDHITEWVDMPTMPAPMDCMACGGIGTVSECLDCKGEGEITLKSDYGEYEVECETCDGDGGADMVCPLCDGLKKRHLDNESIMYQGYRLCLNLLEKIKTLPNIKLGFVPQLSGNFYPPVRFKFDGGIGLLMPMRG